MTTHIDNMKDTVILTPKVLTVQNLSIIDVSICNDKLAKHTRIQDVNVHSNKLINNVSFHLSQGETLAIVGESGSGKSLISMALLGLLPKTLAVTGQVTLEGFGKLPINTEITAPTHTKRQKSWQNIRAKKIALIFQEPMTALNPLHTVSKQLAESLILGYLHADNSHPIKTSQVYNKKNIQLQVVRLLEQVNIENAVSKLNKYPHQLSGGQRQRVMIAMALAQNPDILIADEPTTALDEPLQHEILSLLHDIKKHRNLSLILISHNVSLIQQYSNSIIVLHRGSVLEYGSTEQLFSAPKNAYTHNLINQNYRTPVTLSECNTDNDAILEVRNLHISYPQSFGFLGRPKLWQTIIKNLSFSVRKGESLGIVGRSGVGKSSIGLAVCQLLTNHSQVSGDITIDDVNMNQLTNTELRNFRSHIQMVFQDPYSSLNPRLSVLQIIEEGLIIKKYNKEKRLAAVINALYTVKLSTDYLYRYPNQLSGGERQRVSLARALIMQPKIIVLDEPTSALDKNTQVMIARLLRDIQQVYQTSYILISHDLNLVNSMCHKYITIL